MSTRSEKRAIGDEAILQAVTCVGTWTGQGDANDSGFDGRGCSRPHACRAHCLVNAGTSKAVDIVAMKLREVDGPFVVARAGERAHQGDLANHLDELTGPKHTPRRHSEPQLEDESQRFDEEVSVR